MSTLQYFRDEYTTLLNAEDACAGGNGKAAKTKTEVPAWRRVRR